MNKILMVTGVAGFLGRTLALYFSRKGWEVVGVDIIKKNDLSISFLKLYLQLDLPNPQFIQLLKMTKPNVCIHCAGGASVGASFNQPWIDFNQGPTLTYYVLNCLHEVVPQCDFILLSSAAIYGNASSLPVSENIKPDPISIYGFNKLQSEIVSREFNQVYGQPTSIVRIFSAYGPGLCRQVIWDICEKGITENEVHLHGTGNESRDFIYSSDIARGIELVLTFGKRKNGIYNLACGSQISISDLAALILANLRLENKHVIFNGINPIGNPLNLQANIQKIRHLGFSPQISIEKGVNYYTKWFLSNWNIE